MMYDNEKTITEMTTVNSKLMNIIIKMKTLSDTLMFVRDGFYFQYHETRFLKNLNSHVNRVY
jgi:hypothetical protein